MNSIPKVLGWLIRLLANALFWGYFGSWIVLSWVVDSVLEATDSARTILIQEAAPPHLIKSVELIAIVLGSSYGRFYTLGVGITVATFCALLLYCSSIFSKAT
jgi:hypothetical protein